MKSNKTKTGQIASIALFLLSAGSSYTAWAGDTELACDLYIAESMDSDASSAIDLKDAGLTLSSVRRAGICLFADGTVADKQFVMVDRIVGDGSTGSNLGYSVYTMENGDSIAAQFHGAWGSTGFKGIYTIIGGTGSFENASGNGSITGTPSPWSTTGVVKILLNVKTP